MIGKEGEDRRENTKFSIETTGHFDLDAERKLWIGSDPTPVQKKFSKEVNVNELQKILAEHI